MRAGDPVSDLAYIFLEGPQELIQTTPLLSLCSATCAPAEFHVLFKQLENGKQTLMDRAPTITRFCDMSRDGCRVA